jgi:hypothetical protein
MTTDNRLIQAVMASLFFHLLLFGWLPFLGGKTIMPPKNRLLDRALKVESVSPEYVKKFKTRGVRGGKKGFSMPAGKSASSKKTKKKRSSAPKGDPKSKLTKGKSDLSLKNLATEIDYEKIVSEKEKPTDRSKNILEENQALSMDQKKAIIKKEIIAAESGLPLTSLRSSQTVNNFRRQESLRRGLLKQMGTSSTASEVLSNTNFNLHFEPPDGVSEDELNSVEKIYYSFQKRTFIGYVNSFYSSYQSLILKRPSLLGVLQSERHLMTGKVIFDKEGNIMRIKILRSSSNDDLHELFETTLKDIRSLPNPPKDLVKNREEFTIYYQLRVN